jgi:hypothetical protein
MGTLKVGRGVVMGSVLLYTAAQIDPHGGEHRIRDDPRTWQRRRRTSFGKSVDVYASLFSELRI